MASMKTTATVVALCIDVFSKSLAFATPKKENFEDFLRFMPCGPQENRGLRGFCESSCTSAIETFYNPAYDHSFRGRFISTSSHSHQVC